MSKELNILQAIEMPVGTRFNISDTINESVVVIKSANDFKNELKEYEIEFLSKKFLCWERTGEKLSQGDYEIGLKFIPIQKPVSFMEAVKSGKRIRVSLPGYELVNFCTIGDVVHKLSLMSEEYIRKAILNGKWYIEEE